jgi:hypothetical protein
MNSDAGESTSDARAAPSTPAPPALVAQLRRGLAEAEAAASLAKRQLAEVSSASRAALDTLAAVVARDKLHAAAVERPLAAAFSALGAAPSRIARP